MERDAIGGKIPMIRIYVVAMKLCIEMIHYLRDVYWKYENSKWYDIYLMKRFLIELSINVV